MGICNAMRIIVCAACRQSVPRFNIVRGMCSICYARDMRSRKRIKTKTPARAAWRALRFRIHPYLEQQRKWLLNREPFSVYALKT